MKEALQTYHIPSIAVTDAIMVAEAHMLETYEHVYGKHPRPVSSVLEKATFGECQDASIFALYFLTKKYSQLFHSLALIGTEETKAGNVEKPFRDTWRNHYIFLAQDTARLWYAASPANFTPDTADYMKPIVSKNLSEVLGKITERDGGIWPDAEFVISSLSDGENRPYIEEDPRGKYDFFNYSEICYPKNTVTQKQFTVFPAYRIDIQMKQLSIRQNHLV